MLRLLLLATSCSIGAESMTSTSAPRVKTIVLVRHGETFMNVELRERPWGGEGFVDAQLWDTALTAKGRQQACDLSKKLAAGDHHYSEEILGTELLVSSPLTRAVSTAQLVFDGVELPRCKVPFPV